MRLTLMRSTAFSLCMLTLPACSGEGDPETPRLIESAPTSDVAVAIETDSSSTEIVASDTPQSGCTTNASCSVYDKVCDGASGACVECNYPGDCKGADVRCVKHVCQKLTTCESDKHCANQDAVCDKTAGVCVDCIGDEECGDGEHCKANQCIGKPKDCKTSKDCSDIKQICNKSIGKCVDCEGHVDCDAAEHCFEGLCVPDVCKSGKSKCKLESAVLTCNSEGSAWDETACDAGSKCKGGKCVAQVCVGGTTKCAGNTVNSCKPDGTGWDAKPCGLDEKCVDTDDPAHCAKVICKAATQFCDGKMVMACSHDGTSKAVADDCSKPGGNGGTPGVCVDGKCQWLACKPKSVMCDGEKMLAVCKLDGTSYDKTICPAAKPICVAGACVKCTPGTLSCAPAPKGGESTVVVKCDSSGNDYEIEAVCKGGQLCKGAACASKAVCSTGTTKCDGDKLSKCNTDGTGWKTEACGPGSVCKAGKCGSVATNCVAGAKKCLAGKMTICKSDGSGWQPKSCNDGNPCTSDTCNAGSKNCTFANQPDGSGCGAGLSCKAGKCIQAPKPCKLVWPPVLGAESKPVPSKASVTFSINHGGYAPKFSEYWLAEHATGVVRRYTAALKDTGKTFNTGMKEIIQLAGLDDGRHLLVTFKPAGGVAWLALQAQFATSTVWKVKHPANDVFRGVASQKNTVFALGRFNNVLDVYKYTLATGKLQATFTLNTGANPRFLVPVGDDLLIGTNSGAFPRIKLGTSPPKLDWNQAPILKSQKLSTYPPIVAARVENRVCFVMRAKSEHSFAIRCIEVESSCDDKNECTVDSCNISSSTCKHLDIADGAVCGGSKSCKSGVCVQKTK